MMMASRIALNTLRASASRVRPHAAAVPQILSSRKLTSPSSSSSLPPLAEHMVEIIDKPPSHPSLITKTGTAILGSGLLATAISQELYVFNEKTVTAIGSFILFAYIAKTARLPYKEWAKNHIARTKGVLDGACTEHTKDCIDEVNQMKDVVMLTKQHSKETAQIEADTVVQCHVNVKSPKTPHQDSHLHGGSYPQYILKKAAELNNCNEDDKSIYFPLYDKILYYWFPPTKGYDICPKWFIPGSNRIDGFTVTYAIEHHNLPFLLIEIKPPLDFQTNMGRHNAIIQVINRLNEIGPKNLHADRLYVISAIGKRWRACYALKGKGGKGGHPVKGVAIANSLRSASPECWNPDVTSDASWVALQSIVKTIKGYVA